MSTVQELLSRCGPAIAAKDAPGEVVARAVSDGRALWIWIDSCMGSSDISVSTEATKAPPEIVLARKVPPELSRVGDTAWDYRDDAIRRLTSSLPAEGARKRRRDDPLAAWTALPAGYQERHLAELNGLAKAHAVVGYNPSVQGSPAVDLSEAETADGRLTLRFVFDYMIWHNTISGSTWSDHILYAGEAEYADDVLLRFSTERRESYEVTEFQENFYDRYVARRHLIDVLRAERRPRKGRAAR
jgi:hypothetical protein